MLISLQNLGKSFGDTVVLHDINATVEKGERIGIVGENGAGKTTLLKVLCGEYQPDEGEYQISRGVTLGYLEQNSKLDPTLDVYGEMRSAFAPVLSAMEQMQVLENKLEKNPGDEQLLAKHAELSAVIDAADGYHMDIQIKKVLSGMAFGPETYTKGVAVLSGGEHTRLRLAKLLLQRPDLLILDEPTNHLDFATMEWLEEYLKSYSGAVLVVSHDRYFLDSVCTRIWEVEDHQLTSYKGNYSAYLPQKEAAVALQQKQHDADVAKAQKLEDYIARNIVRASTTKMAQSRRKQLEKMEITEKPHSGPQQLNFKFEFDVTPYKELLTIKNLSVKIGERVLLHPFDLQVLRGERLVIAGPNGAGKSTLMQVLDGKRKPSGGMVRLGAGAKASIFEQQQMRRGGRVIDAIWDKWPRFTELEVRNHLARFGFRGEEVFKSCSALSGGELARLRFAEIVLERPNLLFLDEPTNHLDIYTRESLTQALMAYEGTLLLITHDRYLMNSLECPILYVEDGNATLYPSYERMMHREDPAAAAPKEEKEKAPAGKAAYGKEQRRRKAELRTRIKAVEDEIETLGAHIVELENEIASPEVLRDHVLLRDKCDELEDSRFHQQELFDEWEKLLEEQEQYEQAE
ncbi:ABC-F family ATP-binding cassette domain-containing protein [Allofournierella massiliensis]|uniref:ABC-F family ATP-binding cassette domain-containing protein n=1 Tax=Allofournierella massiliensis TaxID=1650663 RepID=A0ABT7UNU7_9FIRM|nr:ABC-F family ATP-binding cassette domain-containing protein [Fournierella massiliensis]MDM8200425.1 ABC-F family ATP-binding cassette domain-containing protein [Fournierella massiliensis]